LILSDGTAVYFAPDLAGQMEAAKQIFRTRCCDGLASQRPHRQSIDECADNYQSSNWSHRAMDGWPRLFARANAS